MLSFDNLMAQITFQDSNDVDKSMDGKLELREFLNILCAFLLLVASTIRICVNSVEKTKFGLNSGSGIVWHMVDSGLFHIVNVWLNLSRNGHQTFFGVQISSKN